MELSGRTAMVTGAGMGIGAAIAKALSQDGARVAVCDINPEAGEATVKDIRAIGGTAEFYAHDVTSWESAVATTDAIETSSGPIDVLVNNAGISKRKPFVELSETDWDSLMDINLKGVFLTLRAVLPRMIARNYGRVVNMSSVCGKQGAPAFAHYSASKFAIIGLTQSLALEYARTGITLNTVCPGIVVTPLHDQITADAAQAAGATVEQMMHSFDDMVPQGRAQTPEDVARMVTFLASDASRNMTGGSYHVDGGVRMN